MAETCGADLQANTLLLSLKEGKSFEVPDVDLSGDDFKIPPASGGLYGELKLLTTEDLTTRKVGGDGTFDAIMQSLGAHLKGEYEANRITGQEYTKAYIGVVTAALSTAASFLLGRDQAYWGAILAQQQARAAEIAVVQARVQLETAKVGLSVVKNQNLTAEAEYGLTKMKIASEDANYCLLLEQKKQLVAQTAQTEAETLGVKEQTKQTIAQTSQVTAQTALIGEQLNKTVADTAAVKAETLNVPKQGQLIDAQVAKTNADTIHVSKEDLLTEAQISAANQQINDIVPLQQQGLQIDNAGKEYTVFSIMPAQKDLVIEQVNVQRSQTSDLRADGAAVLGLAKAQKDLWIQQITSYKRDAEVKAAKIFSDAWITQKTIDEGLLPPNAFTNGVLDTIMATLKNNNAL